MVYPLPVFHFQVEWGGAQIRFAEVSGLTTEVQVIEYRDGADKEYGPSKMPGIPKHSNLTFKRGVVKGQNQLFEWLNTTAMNTVERKDLTISLLNENAEPVMVWKIVNAFPVKIEGPSLKATGNEAAIESIEVAHEGITIENAA